MLHLRFVYLRKQNRPFNRDWNGVSEGKSILIHSKNHIHNKKIPNE